MPATQLAVTQKNLRRGIFLAWQRGDNAKAEQYARGLARLHGEPEAWDRHLATWTTGEAKPGRRSRTTSTSKATTTKRSAGNGLAAIIDRNPKLAFAAVMGVSTVAGVKINQKLGPVQVPYLGPTQPSTLNGTGLLIATLIARHYKLRRTSRLLLAGMAGQGLATVIAHVPQGALMSPRVSGASGPRV
jgi:hypothetical protein